MTRDEVLTLLAIYVGSNHDRYCELLDVAAKGGHKVAQRLYGEYLISVGKDSLGQEFLKMSTDNKDYVDSTWITNQTDKDEAQRLLVSKMNGGSTSVAFKQAREAIDFKQDWDKIVKTMIDNYTDKINNK